ncbi:putative protein TPRXL [Portunus trituberculatus]|nr:putative protein TPRXL [Portunus trituberculatus]
MNSFDCSYEDIEVREERSPRELSVEGRLRARHFHSYSSSSSSASLLPGQKFLRFSDECWCGPMIEHCAVILSKSRQRQRFGLRSSSSSSSSSSNSSSSSDSSSSSNTNCSITSCTSTNCCYSGATSTERLIDWQRQPSEKVKHRSSTSQSPSPRHTGAKTRRSGRSLSLAERRRQLCSSASLPQSTDTDCTPSTTTSPTSTTTSTNVCLERRRRRSQFRRAWSLFSLTCDKDMERERREKSPQQKILRPPTRHYYRRGASGLPIECSSTYLGLAY